MKNPPYKIDGQRSGDLIIRVSDEDREWQVLIPNQRVQVWNITDKFSEALWVRACCNSVRCPIWVREVLSRYIQNLR